MTSSNAERDADQPQPLRLDLVLIDWMKNHCPEDPRAATEKLVAQLGYTSLEELQKETELPVSKKDLREYSKQADPVQQLRNHLTTFAKKALLAVAKEVEHYAGKDEIPPIEVRAALHWYYEIISKQYPSHMQALKETICHQQLQATEVILDDLIDKMFIRNNERLQRTIAKIHYHQEARSQGKRSGSTGGQSKHERYDRELKQLTLSLLQEGSYKSMLQGARAIAPKVIKRAYEIGRPIPDAYSFTNTVYKWIRESRSSAYTSND